MSNRWRGDVEIVIEGQPHVARLTLGALAELEETLAEDTLVGLVERFEQNEFGASDVIALLGAGLRAGGAEITDETLAKARIGGGAVAAAQVAAELLARAFELPE